MISLKKSREREREERTVIQRTIEFFVHCERPIFVYSRRNERQSDEEQMSLSIVVSLRSIHSVRALSFKLCMCQINGNEIFSSCKEIDYTSSCGVSYGEGNEK